MAALLNRSKLERAKSLKKERIESILLAGLRAFERFSYAEVTLDSVRKLANVPEGKPELYFGTREELFLRVLNRESQKWSATLRDEPGLHRRRAVAESPLRIARRELSGASRVLSPQCAAADGARAHHRRRRRFDFLHHDHQPASHHRRRDRTPLPAAFRPERRWSCCSCSRPTPLDSTNSPILRGPWPGCRTQST